MYLKSKKKESGESASEASAMDARVFECLCETQMFKPRKVHPGALFARVRGVSNVTLRHGTPLTYIFASPKDRALSQLCCPPAA